MSRENEENLDEKTEISENNVENSDNEQTPSISDDPLKSAVDSMPGVSPELNNIKQEPHKTGIRDKTGNVFNPEIHVTNLDGKPKLTQAGTFAKRRGRKKGRVNGVGCVNGVNGNNHQSVNVNRIDELRQSARVCSNIFFSGGIMIFGDDWKPDVDEKNGVETAFTNYLDTKDNVKLPPWLELSVILGSYVIIKSQKPKPKQKISNWFQRTKARLYAWWINRRQKEKPVKSEKDVKKEKQDDNAEREFPKIKLDGNQ